VSLLRVILRGIRYRPGRSAVVAALAAAATAAAVLTPAYTSAAHQSLLTDALTQLPAASNGTRVTTDMYRPGEADGSADPQGVLSELDDLVTSRPGLSVLGEPTRFAELGITAAGGELAYQAVSQLVYRQGFCQHVEMVEGDCTTEPSQVLVSRRVADSQKLRLGDSFTISKSYDPSATNWDVTVAGVYEPVDTESLFWGRQSPFSFGADSAGTSFIDGLFVSELSDFSSTRAEFRAGLEYPFQVRDARLATADDIVTSLEHLDRAARLTVADDPVSHYDVFVDTSFPSVLETVRDEQAAVSRSVPVVTIPLLLLCWFVLYLVVGRLIAERAPQIALAKLRGHRFIGVTGFGIGEALLLIVAGLPLGVLAGVGTIDVVARAELAPGAFVTLTTAVAGYALVAFMGAVAAVLLAARHTVTGSVLALLRRVPPRTGWRAGAMEGGLVALAAVVIWQVVTSSDAGVLALFTTPLLAVLTGVVAARALVWTARRWQPRAARRGSMTGMLALAQLSRRPEIRRVVVLVTVAVSLVTFGVCAWDVSAVNRRLAADDELGAEQVYQLAGGDPQDIMSAVEEIDPHGDSLMGVMRSVQRYDGRPFTVVAAQADRLAAVARWRDHSPSQLADLARRLHPDMPDPLRIKGSIEVDATVDAAVAQHPLKLAARLALPGKLPEMVRLGELSAADHHYFAKLPECDGGCRLVGLGVVRHPGDFDDIDVSLRLNSIADSDGPVETRLGTCGGWNRAWDVPQSVDFDVDCEDGGTRLTARTAEADDLVAEYATAPQVLPVAVAGEIPAGDSDNGDFRFVGPHHELQNYHRTQSVAVVPRAGTSGMLVDLDYTNRLSQSITSLSREADLSYEIWANAKAPDGLAEKLSTAGLVVTRTELRADYLQRLGRDAPALALRLYLLAAAAALLLVIGVVLLTSTIGASARGYDTAALLVSGVPRRTMRRSAVREHLYWISVPTVAGILCGLAGLVLVLPDVALVSGREDNMATTVRIGPWWAGGALLAVVAGFATVTWYSVRRQQHNGRPARLRAGEGGETA
jgi:putative ABC transport system permease protein